MLDGSDLHFTVLWWSFWFVALVALVALVFKPYIHNANPFREKKLVHCPKFVFYPQHPQLLDVFKKKS